MSFGDCLNLEGIISVGAVELRLILDSGGRNATVRVQCLIFDGLHVLIIVGLGSLGTLLALGTDTAGRGLLDLGGSRVDGNITSDLVLLGRTTARWGSAIVDTELALNLSEADLFVAEISIILGNMKGGTATLPSRPRRS